MCESCKSAIRVTDTLYCEKCLKAEYARWLAIEEEVSSTHAEYPQCTECGDDIINGECECTHEEDMYVLDSMNDYYEHEIDDRRTLHD